MIAWLSETGFVRKAAMRRMDALGNPADFIENEDQTLFEVGIRNDDVLALQIESVCCLVLFCVFCFVLYVVVLVLILFFV